MKFTILILMIFSRVFAPEFHTLPIERAEGIWYVSIQDVQSLLKKHQIKSPEIVLTQIILETGHLTSDILRLNNNLFGMSYTSGRPTTAIGERFNSAVYANIEKSVEDYKIWQDLYYRGGDYYLFLKRIGYAQDRKYIEKLKQLLTL